MTARRVTLGLTGVALLATLAFVAVSLSGASAREAASIFASPTVSGLTMVVSALQALRTDLDRRVRAAWALFALSYATVAGGDAMWVDYWWTGYEPTGPSLADALYIAEYPPMLAGLLVLPAAYVAAGERVRLGLDLATVFTSAALVVGHLVVGPVAADAAADVTTALVAAAPPVGDLVVIGGIALLLLRGPSPSLRSTLLVLLASVSCTVFADLWYARMSIEHSYAAGDLVDASWMFSNVLFMYAATREVDAGADDGAANAMWGRIKDALPLGGMGVGFATLVVLATSGDGPHPWLAFGAALLCGLVALRQLHLVLQNANLHAELAVQYDKSERLLANVLPKAIAARLKDRPDQTIADGVPEVTVLFADLVGFTPLSARTAPDVLLAVLNDVFSRFDAVAARHGLEKIKTMGDAYMAAAGVPDPRPDHAVAAARAAIEMIAAIDDVNRERGLELKLRVGLNTGPVVAGVIGSRKLTYDLWGDAVNTASRMESHGVPHAIHVSASTRAALGDAFPLQPRGTIEVKGKGPMETWILVPPAGAVAT